MLKDYASDGISVIEYLVRVNLKGEVPQSGYLVLERPKPEHSYASVENRDISGAMALLHASTSPEGYVVLARPDCGHRRFAIPSDMIAGIYLDRSLHHPSKGYKLEE